MIRSKTILNALPNVLKEIEIAGLGKKENGKVRDFYILPNKRIIITTDRQSAFDVNLGHIPFKGAVLNQLAAFWFNKTKKIVPNHMIELPHPNVLIAHNCQPIPIEMIVRGYISGVTKTSIWYSYQKGERLIYGIKFPEGLQKNQKLKTPVITPTTHGGGAGGHDERLTREEIIKRKIVPEKLYKQMETVALALFDFGSKLCKRNGMILVDTKYEFGLYNGKLMLMDEIHTPDSSRFWKADTYEKRFKNGLEPENFDKEFLRLWYADKGYRGDGTPPPMTEELIISLSQRYIAIYEKLTGKKFKALDYPIENEIARSVQKYTGQSTSGLTYAATGVNYDAMDPLKRMAQKAAASTLKNSGINEVLMSRGESAYVWEEKNSFRASVIEGLGTKNRVADAVRMITKKSYYDAIAQDTVAMIVNDLIVVGAAPQVINAYFAVGSSDWFKDEERARDLVDGWAKACKLAGAVWGGGETPTLKTIIEPDTIDLAGSAVGIITPKKRLTLGSKLKAGDAIVLLESSGIHANGLTLARAIADKVPKGYATKLSDGTSYGEALLTPTHIYAKLVRELFSAGIDIHYMVNITGHGWRKLMRASQPFTYRLTNIPEPQPLFSFIQKHSENSDTEMYGNFNMGAGFAFYLPSKFIKETQKIAKKCGFKSWHAGIVEKGPKQVVIEPKGIVFKGESLQVR